MKKQRAPINAVQAENLPIEEIEARAQQKAAELDELQRVVAGRKRFNKAAALYAGKLKISRQDLEHAYRTPAEKGDLVRAFDRRKNHVFDLKVGRGMALTGLLFSGGFPLLVANDLMLSAFFGGISSVVAGAAYCVTRQEKRAFKRIDQDVKQKVLQARQLTYQKG
jgi:hypothetical protein